MTADIAFNLSGDSITLVIRGEAFSVGTDHPNYKKIVATMVPQADETHEEEQDRADQLLRLVDVRRDVVTSIQAFGVEDVELTNEQVYVNGHPLHNHLTERILDLKRLDLPEEGFVKFLVNLHQNPDPESRESLFDFLEHGGFPITSDGCFLGYKGVKDDFYDVHSGRVHYAVGTVVEMPREHCDANRYAGCSRGLHVGTLHYAKNWASTVILVKVNPRDCVAVPINETQKLRTCRMEVVRVYTGREYLKKPLYTKEEYVQESIDTENVIIRGFSEEELKEKYGQLNRDEACAEAVTQQIFISKSEAKWAGKDLVIESLAHGGIPFERLGRRKLAELAVRRNLFDSVRKAERSGKDTLIRSLFEDEEQRKIADA